MRGRQHERYFGRLRSRGARQLAAIPPSRSRSCSRTAALAAQRCLRALRPAPLKPCELRDGDKGRYLGKGVLAGRRACQQRDAPTPLVGLDAFDQRAVDAALIDAGRHPQQDQARRQRHPGRVAGRRPAPLPSRPGLSLYQYLGGVNAHLLPTPMMNILNGGVHADNNVDFQEFMIMPVGAPSFAEGLRWCAEVYHTLKKRAARGRPGRRRGRRGRLCAQPQDQRRAVRVHHQGRARRPATSPASTSCTPWTRPRPSSTTPRPACTSSRARVVEYTSAQMVDYWEALVDKYPDHLHRGRHGRGGLGRLERAYPIASATRCSWWATTCSSPTPSASRRASSSVPPTRSWSRSTRSARSPRRSRPSRLPRRPVTPAS